jgi:16S rRNA U1498 N3-methylase RsmE
VGVLNEAPATADVHACPTDADPSADLTLRWRSGEERDDPDTARRALSSRVPSANGAADGFRGTAYDGIAKHTHHDTSIRIDLLLAVPRPKVLKRLWAPLASLGVGAVYLTNAARVEKCYFDASSVAAETVQRELVRGLEQSGDVFVPRVTLVKRFPAALDAIGVTGRDPKRESVRALTASLEDDPENENEKAPPDGRRDRRRRADDVDAPLMLVAQPGSAVTLRRALRGAGADAWGYGPKRVVLAIGPEGGWSDHELSVLTEGGFQEVALGNRTLATDVACVALVAAVKERTESW